MGHIKAANPAKSRRLGSVLALLNSRGGSGATTREIIEICKVCAVSAIISELRAAGHAISCKTRVDAGGGRVATYKLEASAVA